jgi:hypothetical protein
MVLKSTSSYAEQLDLKWNIIVMIIQSGKCSIKCCRTSDLQHEIEIPAIKRLKKVNLVYITPS